MSDWRTSPVATHRCTVCGALWRYWSERDTRRPDSWSAVTACGPCCDNAPMLEQIVPASIEDIEKYVAARKAVDAMAQRMDGPKSDDSIN